MTFDEWWNENGPRFNDDYSISSVARWSEKAWNAAQDEMKRRDLASTNSGIMATPKPCAWLTDGRSPLIKCEHFANVSCYLPDGEKCPRTAS